MTTALEGYWRINVADFVRTQLNQCPPPNTTGVIPCPDCQGGTLRWARDFLGYYYLACLDCKHKPTDSKAS